MATGLTVAPTMLRVWPKLRWLTLPLLSEKFRPAAVKLLPKLFNWLTLTASVKDTPAATLLITLPPKLTVSPEMTMFLVPLLMLMPPSLMVTKFLVASPKVTPSNTGRSAN